jgi:hypothetical protein
MLPWTRATTQVSCKYCLEKDPTLSSKLYSDLNTRLKPRILHISIKYFREKVGLIFWDAARLKEIWALAIGDNTLAPTEVKCDF